MSIRYIVGNPGSGKTYLAVAKLYEYFIDEKRKKDSDWEVAYTNINEFDYTKSDKIKPLNLDEFYEALTDLHNLYLDKVTDEELNEKAKELNLHKALFVIDECHSNIFNEKNNKVIIWWLTYHRHLYQDIWLITQNLSLVDTKYKKIAEFFYKAVDGSNRLFGNRFKYALFNAPTMYQKRDIVPGGGISLKFNEDVYNLYHSGNKTTHKSYLKYYLLVGFLLIALFFFLFSLFKDKFVTEEETEAISKQPSIKQEVNVTNQQQGLKTFLEFPMDGSLKFYPYNLKCFDGVCQILELDNVKLPEKYLATLLNDPAIPLHFSDYKELIAGEYIYFLIFSTDVFTNFKNERLNYEKDVNFPTLGSIKPN